MATRWPRSRPRRYCLGASPPAQEQVEQPGPAERQVGIDHPDTLQARELELRQLRRVDPQAALAETVRWLSESRVGTESEAWAIRADAHIQRELGAYDRAVARYEQATQLFTQLGLHAEAAETGLGQVWALRLIGRYDEALRLRIEHPTRAGDQRPGPRSRPPDHEPWHSLPCDGTA